MNPSTESNKDNESVSVDYQYFIQSAVQKKLSWNTLVHLLTDLAPDLAKSQQIIKILIQELEYDSQTYKDSHLFRKGVTSCIFLTLIYTEQEHTRTHTFSKGVGKLSDLKKCGTLYVPYEIT